MNNFLIKLFVKNFTETSNPKVRESYGKLAGFFGIITNLFLFSIKFVIGTLISSVSIIADAINNLSDSASSIITIVGFKLSSKPADKEHPFGHARIEYISGILVSFVIILIGFELIQNSFAKIFNPVSPKFSLIVYIILLVTIFLKLWQAFFYKKIANTINSKTLLASFQDSRNDCISTISVLIGALVATVSSVNIDGYLGLALAIFIIYSGFKLILETSKPLLGEAPDKELINEIEQKVKSYDMVLGVHDLVIHSYGVGKTFASIHCEFNCNESALQIHELSDNIERDFKTQMGIDMLIHMDPIDSTNPKTQELKCQIEQKIKEKFNNSHIHDFRVAWGNEHSNIVFDVCIPFSEKTKDYKIKSEIENIVLNIDENYRLILLIDRF